MMGGDVDEPAESSVNGAEHLRESSRKHSSSNDEEKNAPADPGTKSAPGPAVILSSQCQTRDPDCRGGVHLVVVVGEFVNDGHVLLDFFSVYNSFLDPTVLRSIIW
jgi:hypothetical protein